MMLLTRLMMYLVSTYGLEVIKDRDGRPVLYWSLYTQGSGVSFSAKIDRYEPIIKRMHGEGDLAKAATVKALIDASKVAFRVSYDGSRYTHAETMDVEVLGPYEDSDEATIEAIQCFSQAVAQQKNEASKDAENLLSDLFLLSPSDTQTHREFRTKQYLVELLMKPVPSEEMDELVCSGDFEEDLEDLRRYTQNHQEYVAFIPAVRVHLESSSGQNGQITIADVEDAALMSLNEKFAIRGCFDECVSQAMEMARTFLTNVGSNLKEAA